MDKPTFALPALEGRHQEGFTDDQVLFAYRTFNSFLLGYLLLETSAMTLRDPKPGDGSYRPQLDSDSGDPIDPADPVPGGLTPTRTPEQRRAVREAEPGAELVDPLDAVDAERYPTVHRLAAGLSEDWYQEEFDIGLNNMLDRIERFLHAPGTPQQDTG